MRFASLSLLTICCLLLAVIPATADTYYDNDPYNGTTDAWTINFGFSVSDSFLVVPYRPIGGFDFVYWDNSASDILTTVDIAIGSTSFGDDIFSGTLSDAANTFLGTNQFGYALFRAQFDNLMIDPLAGSSAYVTQSNACTTSGCLSNPIFWDENSGPSTAYENSLGSIPSEAFTVIGCVERCGPPTPEPSSIMLFGSGILSLAGILRRRLGR